MALINFQNVYVDFPVYNSNSKSLKNQLIKLATGGKIKECSRGYILIRALEDITFRLDDGDKLGLLGHNGAGKSTMLRLLSNVYNQTKGYKEVIGEIGSLIDTDFGIDLEFTGRENIYIRGALLGLSKKKIKNCINEIISFSELGNFIDMPLKTYSSGMHLRLAFSISTMINPEILLMDEWLSIGDKKFKKKSEFRLKKLIKSTNILVIASHSKELILKTCNRAIWLEHGCIKMYDTAKKVVENYF